MIKALAFLTLLVSAFAADSWVGFWDVNNGASHNYVICDIVAFDSVANITLNPDGTLNLYGLQDNANTPRNWTLRWDANATVGKFCQEDGWCANGTLTRTKRTLYATITWFQPNDTTGSAYCQTVLVPAKTNWSGYWAVMQTHANRFCPVPTSASYVKVLPFRDQLLMLGTDSNTGMWTSWSFNFTTDQQDAYGCIEPLSLCAKASFGVTDNFMIVANISWVAYNFWSCNATLMRCDECVPSDLSDSTDSDICVAAQLL